MPNGSSHGYVPSSGSAVSLNYITAYKVADAILEVLNRRDQSGRTIRDDEAREIIANALQGNRL